MSEIDFIQVEDNLTKYIIESIRDKKHLIEKFVISSENTNNFNTHLLEKIKQKSLWKTK